MHMKAVHEVQLHVFVNLIPKNTKYSYFLYLVVELDVLIED